jgi:hypothetical protein
MKDDSKKLTEIETFKTESELHHEKGNSCWNKSKKINVRLENFKEFRKVSVEESVNLQSIISP